MSPASENVFIYKHEFQNLAIKQLLSIKAISMANFLVLKKDRVQLRQIWIAEIEFIVLNQVIWTCILSLNKDQ